jgi:hypothetical protein
VSKQRYLALVRGGNGLQLLVKLGVLLRVKQNAHRKKAGKEGFRKRKNHG